MLKSKPETDEADSRFVLVDHGGFALRVCVMAGRRGSLRLEGLIAGCMLLAASLPAGRDYIRLGDSEERVRRVLGEPQRIDRYAWFDSEIWIYEHTLIMLRNGYVYEYPTDHHLRFFKDANGRVTKKYVYVETAETSPKPTPRPTPSSSSNVTFQAAAAGGGSTEKVVPDEIVPRPSGDSGEAFTMVDRVPTTSTKTVQSGGSDAGNGSNPFVSLASLLGKAIVPGNNSQPAEPAPGGAAPENSETPFFAEDGSYYGQPSEYPGQKKTVFIKGYYRPDGTYVKSHYQTSGHN